jgi:magnesium-transporting ATPase (P-type)
MDNILADDSMLELQIDSSSRESLENGSWWARFIGIVFIAVIVLVICLGAFFLQPVLSQLQYRFGLTSATAVIWAIIAVTAVITGVFLALLMSFAVKTNKAVKEMNQDLLEKGIGSLKVYLIVLGVFAILSLLFAFFGVFASAAIN